MARDEIALSHSELALLGSVKNTIGALALDRQPIWRARVRSECVLLEVVARDAAALAQQLRERIGGGE